MVASPVEAGTATAPGTGGGTQPSPGDPPGSGSGHDPAEAVEAGRGTATGTQDHSGNAAGVHQLPAGQGPRTGGSNHPAGEGRGSLSSASHPIDGNGHGPADPARRISGDPPVDGRGSTANGSHAGAPLVPGARAAAAAGIGGRSGSRSAATATIESPFENRAAAAHGQSTDRCSGVAAAAGVGPSDGSAPAGGGESPLPAGTWSRRIIRWVTTVAVLVVAGCAARSSYEHQRTVVEMAGEHRSTWYMPLSVDGMMLVASLNMLVRRWDDQRAGWLTWTALLLGGAASLAANIAAAEPTLIGRVVAGWSPVCLIVSYELLMQQLPRRGPATSTETVSAHSGSTASGPS